MSQVQIVKETSRDGGTKLQIIVPYGMSLEQVHVKMINKEIDSLTEAVLV